MRGIQKNGNKNIGSKLQEKNISYFGVGRWYEGVEQT